VRVGIQTDGRYALVSRREILFGAAAISTGIHPTSAVTNDELDQTAAAIVDVHAHVITPSYQALLASYGYIAAGYGSLPGAMTKPPSLPSVVLEEGMDSSSGIQKRIGVMDNAGVTRQVLSTPNAPYFDDEQHAVSAAQLINDIHSGIVERNPTRFSAFAALPLPHISASLTELKRSLDELGMVGVGIQCFCLNASVADDKFLPIYEELNRRGAVVFFHPCVNGVCSPFVTDWALNATAGVAFEDTLVALHLIIKQIPARFPRIRFILPHFGGALPMLLNRLDNQLPMSIPNLSERPSVTARRFWYDSVGHGSIAACSCAVQAFGAGRILAGSDYPLLLPFEPYRKTFSYIANAAGPGTVKQIFNQNACDLFGPEIAKRVPVDRRPKR
jgi:predicted TIM-barrel fold metal-dependent hydrolase